MRKHISVYSVLKVRIEEKIVVSLEEKHFEIVYEIFMVLAMMHTALN